MSGNLFSALLYGFSRFQYRFYTSTMASLLVPPASVRGMTSLDRKAFTKVIKIPSLRLPMKHLSRVMPVLKKYILKMKDLKSVIASDQVATVYLDPKRAMSLEDILDSDRKIIESFSPELCHVDINISYENWKLDEVLNAILPENVETPNSYSLIGHIVHLNLRESQLPYKSLIGQIFLDKVKNAKTIVNKTNMIDTTFRFFSMEILCGENNTIVEVKENGFRYRFDFAKVYWNPRLSTEHQRIVDLLKADDVLYDVFAGVGPFAIPAARKGTKVLANDLNPESYKWLLENVKLNKIKNNLSAFNKDGKEFLREEIRNDILKRRESNESGIEHIVMNLPAMAVEFLNVFHDLFTKEEIEKVLERETRVYVYCFVKTEKDQEPNNIARNLVEDKLNVKLCSNTLIEIHYVRNVAPNKEMMRVSFILTEKILKVGEPAMKRARINKE